MKPATTITLVAVAGLGFAYLKFVDQKAQTTQDKLKAASKVAVIQRDKINAITISNDGKSIEINLVGTDPGSRFDGVDVRVVYNLKDHAASVMPPKMK